MAVAAGWPLRAPRQHAALPRVHKDAGHPALREVRDRTIERPALADGAGIDLDAGPEEPHATPRRVKLHMLHASGRAGGGSNVVAHGVPYLALVWHTTEREHSNKKSFAALGALALSLLIFLAYFEEGLWDAWVWSERGELFPMFQSFTAVKDSAVLACLVPLLALPQAVHYVMDGFIWRTKDRPFVTR
jgi:hypothetical protein